MMGVGILAAEAGVAIGAGPSMWPLLLIAVVPVWVVLLVGIRPGAAGSEWLGDAMVVTVMISLAVAGFLAYRMTSSTTAANISAVESHYGVENLEYADDGTANPNWMAANGDRTIKVRFGDSKGLETGSIVIDASSGRAVLYARSAGRGAKQVEYGLRDGSGAYGYSDAAVSGAPASDTAVTGSFERIR